MPCEGYKLLESKLNAAKSRWAQFANQQNKRLWGVSERQRKQIIKEEKAAMEKCAELMNQHQAQCVACKAELQTS